MSAVLEHRAKGQSGNPPGQGPFMILYLVVAEGIVREANYETYQCPGCVACGKAVCELVSGQSLSQASGIRREDVVGKVGPLPRHRAICYSLAVLALADALGNLAKE